MSTQEPRLSARSAVPLRPLVANTSAFAVAFAAWVVLGPSTRVISADLGVGPDLAALIKALPILTGSVLRVPIGMASDRWGARRVFPLLLLVAAIGAGVVVSATSKTQLMVGALVLGLAGTTFVPGVQSVSLWTPKERQGFALGVFGAGNVGTALTTFGFPLLLQRLGWRGALGVYALVLALTAVAYVVALPRGAVNGRGQRATLAALLAPLSSPQAWLLGLYYVGTFGVFVATTLSIVDLYAEVWSLPLATAGLIATSFTFTASLARIPGGLLADRFGADRMLRVSLPLVAACLAAVLTSPPLPVAAALFVIAGLAMGAGMAATFKAIPARFPDQVGAVGGIVGALGGVGGFFLPLAGAWSRREFDNPFAALIPLLLVAVAGAIVERIAESRRRAPHATGSIFPSARPS